MATAAAAPAGAPAAEGVAPLPEAAAAAAAAQAAEADASPLESFFEVSDGDLLGPPVDDELLLQDLWEEVYQQGWDPALYDLKPLEAGAEAAAPAPPPGGAAAAAGDLGAAEAAAPSSAASAAAAEDAPPGSSAHLRVRYYASQRRWTFKIPGAEENKFFQVTTRASKISEEDAGRIARLCFVRFEEGAEKSEVEAYKHNLMELCVSRGKAPAPASGTAVAAAARELAESPDVGSKRRRLDEAPPPAPAAPPQEAPPQEERRPSAAAGGPAAAAAALEDAPEGSDAFASVKIKNTGSGGKICFFEKVGKHGVRMQTTQNAAAGCLEEAARICRLCYLKAKSGATKEEVMAYRQELYRSCQQQPGGGGSSPPPVAPQQQQQLQRQQQQQEQPPQPPPCSAAAAEGALPSPEGGAGPPELAAPAEAAAAAAQQPGDVAKQPVRRPLDAVPMTPAGYPPCHANTGPPQPVTPNESLGLDANGAPDNELGGTAGGPERPASSATAAEQQWEAHSWGSEAWHGGPGAANSWAGTGEPAPAAAWRGGGGPELTGWTGRGPPPPPPPPPPATAGALPMTPTVGPQEQQAQPRSPSAGANATMSYVEKAQLDLGRELRGLTKKLCNTNCVPATAVSILEDYVPRYGVASAFAALSDAFNACAEVDVDGDEEQREALRQVLMYLCHEILDLSMLYPHNQTGVFEQVRCNFFETIVDAVCKAPVSERVAYERLLEIWEQRQFFEGSVIEGLRAAWHLES